jgi:hypothetical protein
MEFYFDANVGLKFVISVIKKFDNSNTYNLVVALRKKLCREYCILINFVIRFHPSEFGY